MVKRSTQPISRNDGDSTPVRSRRSFVDMAPKIEVKHNSVAILGFHSGSAGQTETWFEEVTGYHLACFVHETPEEEWAGIDAEAQNKQRISQRMDYPTQNSFKGHPFIASLDRIEILKDLGINKVLPLT